ncbi:hypothetical protein [Azospirillum sp.]|uniref:hypothetical protein n=1 Tax=Azospirillum sp. TaxID=34012 RepID=UPI003D73E870
MTALVWLMERDVVHLASGHVHRFYFATAPGYQCKRTDSTPDLVYVPLVDQAANLSVTVASYGEVAGDTRIEVGESRLMNTHDWQNGIPIRYYDVTAGTWGVLPTGARPLNHLWTDYARAASRLAVLVGPETGSRDADFQTRFVVGEEMAALERTAIVLRPRDKALDFDTPLQVETYGGTGGVDGTADLGGKTKERCFGHVLSMEPTYLGIVDLGDGPLHTYGTNGGHPIEGVVRFRDGYVDLTEVTSGVPTSGQWKQRKTTGMVQLGGSSGQNPVAYGASCEVKGDKTGGVWRVTIADLIRFWATTHSGILSDPSQIDTAAFSALNAAAPYTIGKWLPAGSTDTLRTLFDEAVQSARAYWLMDETQKLSVGQILPASGTPVRTLRRGSDHMGLIPRDPSERKVPAKAALIRTGRNYAVADTATLDRNLTGDARNIATSEWRESRSTDDAGVVAAYGSNIARLIERDTLLRYAADGATEAAALRDDTKMPRYVYELPCAQYFTDVRRGDVVQVVDDLAGYESGGLLRVIGVQVNQRAKLSTFILRE